MNALDRSDGSSDDQIRPDLMLAEGPERSSVNRTKTSGTDEHKCLRAGNNAQSRSRLPVPDSGGTRRSGSPAISP